MSLWPTNHSMRGEPPHLEGPSDAPGRLTSYPTSGKVQTYMENVKNTGFLRKTVAENYGRRSQIAKNLGKSAILAC